MRTRVLLKAAVFGAAMLVIADAAVAAGLGPFEFSFFNSALTGLFLLPLRMAGCG